MFSNNIFKRTIATLNIYSNKLFTKYKLSAIITGVKGRYYG